MHLVEKSWILSEKFCFKFIPSKGCPDLDPKWFIPESDPTPDPDFFKKFRIRPDPDPQHCNNNIVSNPLSYTMFTYQMPVLVLVVVLFCFTLLIVFGYRIRWLQTSQPPLLPVLNSYPNISAMPLDPSKTLELELYSTLLHLPPLRFHCVMECWDRTQDAICVPILRAGQRKSKTGTGHFKVLLAFGVYFSVHSQTFTVIPPPPPASSPPSSFHQLWYT